MIAPTLPRRLPSPLWIVGFLALFGAGCAPGESSAPAPQWSGVTLAGEPFDLAELRGEVVILNIWATWCVPCRREMPALQRLHESLEGRGLRVLGVSVDRGSGQEGVVEFVESFGLTFPILLDPEQRIMARFRTLGVPETYLLDRNGEVAHRWIGEFDPLAEAALERIETLLEIEP